jgi:hypothetical protein
MTNPKPQKGPTASYFFPVEPNELVRKAINDDERGMLAL